MNTVCRMSRDLDWQLARTAKAIGVVVVLMAAATRLVASQGDRRLPPQTVSERRLALVVGASNYPDRPIPNAVNDARALAAALRDLRFEVTEVLDPRRPQLERAVDEFTGRLSSGDVALFYYAGHGFQIENENYMVPVGFKAADPVDAKYEAYSVSRVHEKIIARGVRLAIVILDACRDNPFSATRSAAGGWAAMGAGRGSFIVFATAPGQTASDNPNGRNGLFSTYLLEALREPALGLDAIFNRVRERVVAASENRQVPWTQSSVVGDFVFRGDSATSTSPLPASPPTSSRAPSPSSVATPSVTLRPPSATTSSLAPPLSSVTTTLDSANESSARRMELRMSQVPAGTFQMGCVEADSECHSDEKPRHTVKITRDFTVMTTEVTVGMFRLYALASGKTLPNQPAGNADTRRPVVNVTWDEAATFCEWLGGRLLTESEWEYVARGGQQGRKFVWGNQERPFVDGRKATNVADESSKRKYPDWSIPFFLGYDDGFPDAAPVGSFAPNGFGLYDMAGNVWEWVADWSGPYAESTASNPQGASSGERRVVRGGSWSDGPGAVRVSIRGSSLPTVRDNYIGIRCAK